MNSSWSVRKIVALALCILAPILFIAGMGKNGIFTGLGAGFLVANIAYFVLGGVAAWKYALSNAFSILRSHIGFPGFSLMGLLIWLIFVVFGAFWGGLYFVFLPIVMFIKYNKEME